MDSPGTTIRLLDARQAWLEDARFRRLSPVTLREYDRVSAAVVDFVAVEAGEDPPLAKLTPRLLRRWLMVRLTELRPASADVRTTTVDRSRQFEPFGPRRPEPQAQSHAVNPSESTMTVTSARTSQVTQKAGA